MVFAGIGTARELVLVVGCFGIRTSTARGAAASAEAAGAEASATASAARGCT